MDKFTVIISGILDMSAVQASLQTYYQYPMDHMTISDDDVLVFVSSGLPLNSIEGILLHIFQSNEITNDLNISIIPYDVFERFLNDGKTNSRSTIR